MSSDRDPTPALGVKLLAQTREAGSADPIGVQTQSDLINEIARRAAIAACAEVKQSKPEVSGWVLKIGGVLLTVLVLLWGASVWLNERPSKKDVKELIHETHVQHPDSKATLQLHDASIRKQQDTLIRIESGVEAIKETVKELKAELKRGR